jgi:hypothetical protein
MLANCDSILNTSLKGAKADFSASGRYIAFHAPKANAEGFEIRIVDLKDRTVRSLPRLRGSSFYPSWTRDDRLCFRYDGDDYRGFVMATNVFAASPERLPAAPALPPAVARTFAQIFPETPLPTDGIAVVLVWAPWNAHSGDALRDMQTLEDYVRKGAFDVRVLIATAPASRRLDVDRVLQQNHITLASIPLAPERQTLADAENQIPVTLVFRGGRLVARKLGAQSFAQLLELVRNGMDLP